MRNVLASLLLVAAAAHADVPVYVCDGKSYTWGDGGYLAFQTKTNLCGDIMGTYVRMSHAEQLPKTITLYPINCVASTFTSENGILDETFSINLMFDNGDDPPFENLYDLQRYCQPYDSGDIRAYSLVEIMVACCGFLAFGVGYLMAK